MMILRANTEDDPRIPSLQLIDGKTTQTRHCGCDVAGLMQGVRNPKEGTPKKRHRFEYQARQERGRPDYHQEIASHISPIIFRYFPRIAAYFRNLPPSKIILLSKRPVYPGKDFRWLHNIVL